MEEIEPWRYACGSTTRRRVQSKPRNNTVEQEAAAALEQTLLPAKSDNDNHARRLCSFTLGDSLRWRHSHVRLQEPLLKICFDGEKKAIYTTKDCNRYPRGRNAISLNRGHLLVKVCYPT